MAGGAMEHPVLVIGSTGMVGRSWCAELDRMGKPFTSVSRSTCDLSQPRSIAAAVGEQFRTVINCAAWTDVDAAESEYESADVVNGEAVGVMAERCRSTGALLVHYSTDYVFNGQGDRPYEKDHLIEPINAYGRTKANGERQLCDSGCTYLLVRTSWVYAPWGRNFVATISRIAANQDEIRVVDDQLGCPTSAEHLAGATVRLIDAGARGTYHVTDGGACTWFGFAGEIIRRAGVTCRVLPCETRDFPRPARRPAYGVLDVSESEGLIGPMPCWQDNLGAVIERMESTVS